MSLRPGIIHIDHVNLNIPSHEPTISFYHKVLGFKLDPRRAHNYLGKKEKGTVWMNAGASQFHFPYGPEAQILRGEIGISYRTRNDINEVLKNMRKYGHADRIVDSEHPVTILDPNGNTLKLYIDRPPTSQRYCHPVVEGELSYKSGAVGIRYVEYFVPPSSISGLADFYDSVFGCDVSITGNDNDNNGVLVVVAGGADLDGGGQVEQRLVFREKDGIAQYDGHHMSVFVGNGWPGFNAVFNECLKRNIVFVNDRFSDKVMSLPQAEEAMQFRIKDLNGLYELEHEIRCEEHDAYTFGDEDYDEKTKKVDRGRQ